MEVSELVALLDSQCFKKAWSAVPSFPPFWSIVFFLGKTPVGYVIGMVTPPQGEILRIGVLKKYRGLGIGKKLIRLFLEEAKKEGVKKVFLEVGVKNLRALSLYRKMGFREINRRKALYSDGEDAIVMAKEV